MRLRSFRVRGYKNLRAEIALDGLSVINVIHGPNNVGKSNLLEAIALYFYLLGLEQDGWLPIAADRRISDGELFAAGFPRAEIFDLEQPAPIEMSAELETDAGELVAAGIEPLLPCNHVTVSLVLQWTGADVAYRVRRFELADGTEAAEALSSPEKKTFVLRFAKFLTRNFQIRTAPAERFALVPAERRLDSGLLLALYDAKESADIAQVRRWERFVAVMKTFTDILGDGAFVSTYDRASSQARLVYQTASVRIPFQLLGTGIQQITVLVARLLMTNATHVAIEEPELNLRYSLQERLRTAFAEICGAPGGPTQLFLTSHSPAFESGSHFYLMRPAPAGPVVERREVGDALVATDFPGPVEALPGRAVRCYLSSEGVVRVPDRLLKMLGVPGGGGVTFVEGDEPGVVEMMSNAAFLDRFGLGDDRGDGGEG